MHQTTRRTAETHSLFITHYSLSHNWTIKDIQELRTLRLNFLNSLIFLMVHINQTDHEVPWTFYSIPRSAPTPKLPTITFSILVGASTSWNCRTTRSALQTYPQKSSSGKTHLDGKPPTTAMRWLHNVLEKKLSNIEERTHSSRNFLSTQTPWKNWGHSVKKRVLCIDEPPILALENAGDAHRYTLVWIIAQLISFSSLPVSGIDNCQILLHIYIT